MAETEAAGDGSGLRLAELIAALSLGTDLGLGQPMEHILRSCLIALRLGEDAGMAEAERPTLYYTGLIAWVGCHADSYELAKWFGDDIALKGELYGIDTVGLLPHQGSRTVGAAGLRQWRGLPRLPTAGAALRAGGGEGRRAARLPDLPWLAWARGRRAGRERPCRGGDAAVGVDRRGGDRLQLLTKQRPRRLDRHAQV